MHTICNFRSGLAFGTKQIKNIGRIIESLLLTPSLITELNLSNCNVGNEGCKIIGNTLLKDNKTIVSLKLRFSNIGPKGLIALFDGISQSIMLPPSNNNNLMNLKNNYNDHDNNNNLHPQKQQGQQALNKCKLCVLQHLDLTGNDFHDIVVTSLCRAIVNSNLETLILRSTSWVKGFGVSKH